MITEWRKMALVIVPTQALGDELYLDLRAFPNDPPPAESVFTAQLNDGYFAAEFVAKQSFANIADEFNSDGYPVALLTGDRTEQDIDDLRLVVHVDHYELYPDDGPRVEQPNALDDFIAAKGFTRV